ncbi:MAG: pyrroline-5-carboxylate reductase [Thermodesulfobacteriota bacterium]
MDTIGFVGGGRMASALIRGILTANLKAKDQILVADPDLERREILARDFGVSVAADGRAILDWAGIIVLAVKPQVMAPVLAGLASGLSGRHLVISIAAGIPIAYLEQCLAGCGCRLVRVMPNTPALVLSGASAVAAGRSASEEDLSTVLTLFRAVGQAVVVEERLMDAVTGLSGSGPAYVLRIIEALIDAGVREGLPREVARTLVLQTVTGSTRLLAETGQHPAALRDMVTSPGGTTMAGLAVMERAGLAGLLMDAVAAATDRSRELGSHLAAGV